MRPREYEEFAAFYDRILSDIEAMRDLEILYPDKKNMPNAVRNMLSCLIERCIIDTMVNWVAEEPWEDGTHSYVYDKAMNGDPINDGIDINYVYAIDMDGNRIAVESITYDPYEINSTSFSLGAWKTDYHGIKTDESIELEAICLDELSLSSQKKLLHDMLLPLCSFYEPDGSFEEWEGYDIEKNNMYFMYLRDNFKI